MDEPEDDTSNLVAVLVHLDRDDWKLFKQLSGPRRASRRLRRMVKEELAQASVASR